ncbi:helix-turn-helix domain-containing protein [Streptomyces sp. NPDC059618]|uniref:helix-turn-helix domain-containing protein n=1 Tax=Streptomyces sp. NPDC059618 TaxID=3346887 RepID=UPI00369B2E65
MPRGEASLPQDGIPALVDLARALRSVRGTAGLTYRGLAASAAYSPSVLSTAASGRELPSWPVTWAYAGACDPQADRTAWLERWRRAERAVGRTKDAGGSDTAAGGTYSLAPHPLVAEFGHLLDGTVKTSGKSLRQISRSAGYAPGTLSKDIRGKALPPWERVRDVLQVIGVLDSEIEQVWKPRWKRADHASQRANAAAEATAVPQWYVTARAAARRRLAPHDPMHEGTTSAPWVEVGWRAASAHLHDEWEADAGALGVRMPQLSGRGAEITDVYRTISSGRLVVLGSAGAGASNLVRRLGMGLIEGADHAALAPIPLLLPLMTWTSGTLQEWIDHQAVRAFGRETVDHLTEHRLLLPLLDGLHHLTPEARVAVLEAANTFDPNQKIVLTSRLTAYAELVERTGTVLSGSAAVHLQPLGPAELAEFLPAGASHQGRSWHHIIESLQRGDPRTAALREVCATPFMAATVRRRHLHAHAFPDMLLDTDQFPDAAALRTHLVEYHLAVRYGVQQGADSSASISLTCLRSVLGRASRRAGDPTLVAPSTLAQPPRRLAAAAFFTILLASPATAFALLPLIIALCLSRPGAPRTARRPPTHARRIPASPSDRSARPSVLAEPRLLSALARAITLTLIVSSITVALEPHSSELLGEAAGQIVILINSLMCLFCLIVQARATRPVDDIECPSAPAMITDDASWALRLFVPWSAAAALLSGALTLSPVLGMVTFVEGLLLGFASSVGVRHHLHRSHPVSQLTWITQKERYEQEIAATWDQLHREDQAIRDQFQDPLAGDPRVLIGRAVNYRHRGDLQVLIAAVCIGVLVPVGGAFRLSHPALAHALPIGSDTPQTPVRRLLARWLLPAPKAAA